MRRSSFELAVRDELALIATIEHILARDDDPQTIAAYPWRGDCSHPLRAHACGAADSVLRSAAAIKTTSSWTAWLSQPHRPSEPLAEVAGGGCGPYPRLNIFAWVPRRKRRPGSERGEDHHTMRLIDYFGQAYIINLAHRTDRMIELGEELARIGLDPEDPRFERFDAHRPRDQGGFPSLGAHGCFMSHLGLLKKAREQGLERVWILEDDVSFDPRLPEHEAKIVEQLEAQPDWGFVYIGHGHETSRSARHRAPTMRRTDEPLVCAHCLGISRSMFDPLIAYLERCRQRPAGHPEGGPMHVDGAYSMFRRFHDGAITVLVDPSLAGQRSSRTDIHALGLLDRLAVTRPLMAQLRRARNTVRRMPNPRAMVARVEERLRAAYTSAQATFAR